MNGTIFSLELMNDKELLLFSIIIGSAAAPLFFLIMGMPVSLSYGQTLEPPLPPYYNVTHKLVHKFGWHRCQDDPGVWCKGAYTVNETILRYNPPPPPSAFPLGYSPPPPH